nr:immunoglobulin heavy chain junction region [Mus musculus]
CSSYGYDGYWYFDVW